MASFIQNCEDLFSKIKQKRTIQECLNAATASASIDPYEPIWFVYYMFFAIHNPKMEEYINKKASISSTDTASDIASVLKNMIKRSQYTSTIVYQLYTHAYTNNGNVTHVYPKYKEPREIIIKSYVSNHLKTTAVHIRRAFASSTIPTPIPIPTTVYALLEHIVATATTPLAHTTNTPDLILQKINHIQYKRKDIILLALVCHMKIDNEDVNTKSIFISATPDDIIATTATTATTTTAQPEPEALALSSYDIKYKYLYT